MASFPLQNDIFPTHVYSTQNLRMFSWHYVAKILHAYVQYLGLIICIQVVFYDLSSNA